jgi:hypothetical protein
VKIRDTIANLAERIERAYRLRHSPTYQHRPEDDRVFVGAAAVLIRLHQLDSTMPLDPELFVASQTVTSAHPNPERDLIRPEAFERFRLRVRRIIRGLHKELAQELKWLQAQLEMGLTLEQALALPTTRMTPMGRYIAAHRAGCLDLAETFRQDAHRQHLACPLYRHACTPFLPKGSYPVEDLLHVLVGTGLSQIRHINYGLN